MSHLMNTLLADQRRIEADPEYIAPVVADEDRQAREAFVSLPGQDSRVARLMVQCAELRAKLDAERDRAQAAENVATKQARRIGELLRQVADLRGDGVEAAAGCVMVDMRLPGGETITVEASYSGGCPATDVDPGEPTECWADRVFVLTGSGARLVPVHDLCAVLQDDAAVLKAVEDAADASREP